jgi:DNA-directed RNA polymerase subunit K/omega
MRRARGGEGSKGLPPILPLLPAPVLVLRFMPEMDETIEPDEQPQDALIPAEPAPPITSRFLFVDVAALRAKQLRRGAHQRLGDEPQHAPHKAERVAMEEVRRGLVHYDVPTTKAAMEGEA